MTDGGRADRRAASGDGREEAPPVVSPSAELPPPTAGELDALRRAGRRWGRAGPPPPLPLDPTLGRYPSAPARRGWGRLARIELFQPGAPGEPDELVATGAAAVPPTRRGRAFARIRRYVLGPPLVSAALLDERMRKLVALPVLASDLLSSVAYGPEAMITILVLAGDRALGLTLPLAAALVVLMVAVGVSYRQIIPAYPHGAGSYLVAGDNLGARAGLAAAAGLMTDYVLTVAVSVAAGVHAVTSALPALLPWTVPLGLLVVAVLLAGNLRGVRAAGHLFAAPTYLFLVALAGLLVAGFVQVAGRGFAPAPPPSVPAVEGLGLLLVLRAFSSGAASMTGIEAVSNAVPAFREPQWRNARATLTWQVGLLVGLFAGSTVLFHLAGLVPRADETLLSQLARRTFPTGPGYALIQAATAVILLVAANTAFNGFPRLLYFMARNGHAPRRFLHMGDRLAFTSGIGALTVAAAALLVAFRGHTEALIPLYAVGVFLAFTLSQAGMVVHWWRRRGARWRFRLTVNLVGAVLSGLVLLTAAVTKLLAGAWVVVLAIPLLVLFATRIQRHYAVLHRALSPRSVAAGPDGGPVAAGPDGVSVAGGAEAEECPQDVRHLIVVPVARLNRAALRALAYAGSLGAPAFAVHIGPEEAEAERFRTQWEAWGDHLRLETVVSPYRAVVPPLVHYLAALRALRPELTLTVILPETVVAGRWQHLLHSRTEQRLRRALRALPGVVVASVPIHVRD